MKLIYALLGLLCLGIGIAGVILPMMPGTPFLFLTLFFFAKSSNRLHNWFLQTELYHKHLKTFKEQRALTKQAKSRILLLATAMLSIGFYFTPSVVGKSIIIMVLLIKYWAFFFWIKTVEV